MQSIVSAWKALLPDGSPSGEDLSFAPEFEALKAEVEKSESIHTSAGTDWSEVRRICTELLSARSKDLWLLSYGVYACYQVDGFDACPAAFACLNDLLESHWDSLFPAVQRPQRRLAPLRWLHSRMDHCGGNTGFFRERAETILLLRAQFTRLDIFLNEKYGDQAPCFTCICDAPSVATQDDVSFSLDEPRDSVASSSPSTPSPLGNTLERMEAEGRVPSAVLPQLVRSVMDHTRQLAGHFLSLNACDERAYLLHRAALWGTLLQPLRADRDGQTQMTSGVPQERVQAYASAIENKQYAEVLPQLERSAAKAPYWLDGHCMVARCLEALEAKAALACVRGALARLLERFPELLGYTFRDGSPFVSPKMMPWFEALFEVQPAIPLSRVQTSTRDNADEEALLQSALTLNAEKGFTAGLHHLGHVPAGKSRAAIIHALLQARYCQATGRKAAAQHLLSGIYSHLEQWDLLDWEPELSARVLTLLLSVGSRQRGHSEEMLHHLFWFDPDAAINLLPEK